MFDHDRLETIHREKLAAIPHNTSIAFTKKLGLRLATNYS